MTTVTVQDFNNTITALLALIIEKGQAVDRYDYINMDEELEDHPLNHQASCEFFAVFINDTGRPKYSAIAELKELSGLNITAGEQDSFGWLSAKLVTPQGTLVFC